MAWREAAPLESHQAIWKREFVARGIRQQKTAGMPLTGSLRDKGPLLAHTIQLRV